MDEAFQMKRLRMQHLNQGPQYLRDKITLLYYMANLHSNTHMKSYMRVVVHKLTVIVFVEYISSQKSV